jgi:hypothetical protein
MSSGGEAVLREPSSPPEVHEKVAEVTANILLIHLRIEKNEKA